MFKNEVKEAIFEAFEFIKARNELKEFIKDELFKAINEDKWITIHPHGDDSEDYRRLKLKDGETPKEAMHRLGWYEKRKAKDEKKQKETEDLNKKIQELKEYAKKVGGEKTVLGQKYLKQAEELEKQLKENKEKELNNLKGDKAIIDKLSEMSKEIEQLEGQRWKHSWDTPERKEVDEKLTHLKQQSSELSKKLSFMGDSWKNAKGDKVEVTKFEDGKYVLTTYGDDKYSFNRSYTYFTDAQKIFELKKADEKAYEVGQKKRQEKEARISKKVTYKKGGMPKAKTREEAKKLAEEYNIADSVNYGSLSVDVCNAMNESANDILAEFPKIRSLNKEFGSLQAKNKNLIDEAFEIQGEALAIPIRANMEKLRNKYGDEYFERYYGNKETVEKKITEKVKSILKNKIGIYKASGEIAHCRYMPPSQAGIVWNEKFKNSKNFDYTCEVGFHPQNSGSLKAIVDHEFGHQIDRFIQLKGGEKTAAYTELKNYHSSLSKAEINDGLSKYASTKFAEFIAEGFSEYKNNPNPRPMAQKIGKLLTQAYKEVEDYV